MDVIEKITRTITKTITRTITKINTIKKIKMISMI